MERMRRLQAEAYDRVSGDEEELPSPYEATYRDGSVKHECWHDTQASFAMPRKGAHNDDQD